jgi:hypothetical protein
VRTGKQRLLLCCHTRQSPRTAYSPTPTPHPCDRQAPHGDVLGITEMGRDGVQGKWRVTGACPLPIAAATTTAKNTCKASDPLLHAHAQPLDRHTQQAEGVSDTWLQLYVCRGVRQGWGGGEEEKASVFSAAGNHAPWSFLSRRERKTRGPHTQFPPLPPFPPPTHSPTRPQVHTHSPPTHAPQNRVAPANRRGKGAGRQAHMCTGCASQEGGWHVFFPQRQYRCAPELPCTARDSVLPHTHPHAPPSPRPAPKTPHPLSETLHIRDKARG